MTPNQFRRLALALPDATEGAHGGHPDFRVGGKSVREPRLSGRTSAW